MTTYLGNHLFQVKNEKHRLWPKLVPLSVSPFLAECQRCLLCHLRLSFHSLYWWKDVLYFYSCVMISIIAFFLFLWISIALPTFPTFSCMTWSESCSVVSDSLRPQGLYSPWNSPSHNTLVGSFSLLQGIFPTQGLNSGLPQNRRQILTSWATRQAQEYWSG